MATFAAPTNPTENPPTLPDDETSPAYKLFRHYRSRPVGRNVYIYSDGTVTEADPDGYATLWKAENATSDTLVGAPYVTHVFWGGHEAEPITAAEATLLTNAGYTVT